MIHARLGSVFSPHVPLRTKYVPGLLGRKLRRRRLERIGPLEVNMGAGYDYRKTVATNEKEDEWRLFLELVFSEF